MNCKIELQNLLKFEFFTVNILKANKAGIQ